ncbi:MAG: PorT family protein [Flaviramulus sp.]|nr:porin family protein [Flaviramulus sp.]NNC49456.1 PorT family protein [Flaviramulus sp.]
MKNILLITILLGFTIRGFSQDTKPTDSISLNNTEEKKSSGPLFQGVKYGVRAGYNISNLHFDGAPTMENKHRNSVFIGFLADIRLSKTVSLIPELQFSAEGANAEVLHLDYIQMPILINFRLSEKIHAGFGPQAGLKIHKYEDGAANLAYSALVGVDYKISYAIFADVRYTYGIRNVFDEKSGVSAKNTNIQIGVGYKF